VRSGHSKLLTPLTAKLIFFTRESSYCFQHVLAIALLAVCPSHGWISQKWYKTGSPNLRRRLPGRL